MFYLQHQFFPRKSPRLVLLNLSEICICPVFGRGPGFSRSDGRKWELFEARNLYKYNQSTGRPRNLKFLSPVSCARCVGYFFVCLWASKKKTFSYIEFQVLKFIAMYLSRTHKTSTKQSYNNRMNHSRWITSVHKHQQNIIRRASERKSSPSSSWWWRIITIIIVNPTYLT